MRVLINALAAVGTRTGIGHYISEVVRCLGSLSGPDQIDTFPTGCMTRAAGLWSRIRPWALRQGQGTSSASASGGAGLSLPGRRSWKGWLLQQVRQQGRSMVQWRFQKTFRKGGYDLYHEPNFIPLRCDGPIVVTVHDLSVILHPEWHPADRVDHFERHFLPGLSGCEHLLAISESARQEIIRTLGIAPERVTRTYMGIRPGLGPLPLEEVRTGLTELGLPPQYLLYLGTLEPRKNVLTLLRAYCDLPAALRERYPLVLVGGWGWNSAEVADFLNTRGRHRQVLHLGYVPDALLPLLYNGARALVYPSFYEGFGLPPVEMLACGGAVLASTAASIRETVGGQAHLIEPNDTVAWRQAIERVLIDDEWWRSLRQGAEDKARPFTWEQCALDTLAVYRRVAEKERLAA